MIDDTVDPNELRRLADDLDFYLALDPPQPELIRAAAGALRAFTERLLGAAGRS